MFLVHRGHHLGVLPRHGQAQGLLVELVHTLHLLQVLLLTVHLVDQTDHLGVLDSGFQLFVARLEDHFGVHVHREYKFLEIVFRSILVYWPGIEYKV